MCTICETELRNPKDFRRRGKPRTHCAALSPPVSDCCVTPPMFHHLLHRDQVPAHHEARQPTPQHTHTLQSLPHSSALFTTRCERRDVVPIRESSTFLDASRCRSWRFLMNGVRSLEPTNTNWQLADVDCLVFRPRPDNWVLKFCRSFALSCGQTLSWCYWCEDTWQRDAGTSSRDTKHSQYLESRRLVACQEFTNRLKTTNRTRHPLPHVSHFHLKLTSAAMKKGAKYNQPSIEDALSTLPSSSERGARCLGWVAGCSVWFIKRPWMSI